jgi:hypothetical protein
MTKYIGFLSVGDVIQCADPDGLVITVTIKSIKIDPTWGRDGSVLIGYHHEPSGNDGEMIMTNLVEWFKQADWHKVTA